MPFIEKSKRYEADLVVDQLHYGPTKPDGTLNYILYKFFKETVGKDMSYNKCKNFLGELQETIEQIRHDFLIPYEESKRKENGDV